MKKFTFVKIHPLFVPFILLFLYQKKLKLFLLLLLFVTVHELGHCLTALAFGAKLKQIFITPIGEKAIIENMDSLSYGKRQLILLSGPLISLIMACIYWFIENRYDYAGFHLLIAGFNLLPFLPMDGGNLLLNCAGKTWGTVKVAGYMIKVSKGFGYFLIFLGILQAIFSPFNLSLLFIGIYICSMNKKEYLYIIYQSYKNLLFQPKGILPVCHKLVGEDIRLGDLVATLNTDYYFIFYREKDGNIEWKTQRQVMMALMEKGTDGTVW